MLHKSNDIELSLFTQEAYLWSYYIVVSNIRAFISCTWFWECVPFTCFLIFWHNLHNYLEYHQKYNKSSFETVLCSNQICYCFYSKTFLLMSFLSFILFGGGVGCSCLSWKFPYIFHIIPNNLRLQRNLSLDSPWKTYIITYKNRICILANKNHLKHIRT